MARAGGDINVGTLHPRLSVGKVTGPVTQTDGWDTVDSRVTVRPAEGEQMVADVVGGAFTMEGIPVGNNTVTVAKTGYVASAAAGDNCYAPATVGFEDDNADVGTLSLAPTAVGFLPDWSDIVATDGTTWYVKPDQAQATVLVVCGFATQGRVGVAGSAGSADGGLPAYDAYQAGGYTVPLPPGAWTCTSSSRTAAVTSHRSRPSASSATTPRPRCPSPSGKVSARSPARRCA